MKRKTDAAYKRNYWALALEGSFFMGGIALMSTSGSIALFINAMTGSKQLIGLAVTLQALCILLGQLFTAPMVRSVRRIPTLLLRAMLVQRVLPLIIAVPLFMYASPMTTVVVFLVLYSTFWLIDGSLAAFWGELCVRALEPSDRGHMMGMQVALGGAASLLTGLGLTRLLAMPNLSDHTKYGLVFVLTSVILLFSIFFMRMVKDPSPNYFPEKPRFKQYYVRIPAIIRERKHLRRALCARIPAFIAFSSISFMMVFGISHVPGLTESQISWLVYANIIGGLIGGVVLAEISRRYGSKANVNCCAIGALLSLGMALSLYFHPGLGYIWLFLTCTLASVSANSWFGYLNYFLDIAPEKERSVFQVIGTCVGIPFSFSGYVLGAVIDRYGFVFIFIAGGICAVAAIILNSRLLSKAEIDRLNASSLKEACPD